MRFLILYSLAFLTFIGCSSKNKSETIIPIDNSRDSVDWQGVYIGVLPCDDCEGTQTRLTLTQDRTYGMEIKYIGKESESVSNYGSFIWNQKGNKIQLMRNGRNEDTLYFLVVKNNVVQLTKDAERYSEDLEKNYILRKIQS